jgi:hypothetical protein
MDPTAFGERGLDDPGLRALCRAVRCEAASEGRGWASEVTLRLRDGRTLTRAEDDFPGTPTKPLTQDALRDKYRRCAGDFGAAERLLAQLERIESIGNVRELALA